MSKNPWRYIWAGWIIYFAAAERQSLKNGAADAPLSWHLRWVLGIKSHKAHKFIGAVAFWGGIAWLYRHLYKGATT